MSSFLIFLIIFYILVFLMLNLIYEKNLVYYLPLEYTDKKTNKKINIHQKYEAFSCKDSISYPKIILFGLFLYPIKLILSMITVTMVAVHLRISYIFYKHTDTNPEHRKKAEWIIKFWSSLALKTCMISLEEKKLELKKYENVYKKYLGNDYNFSDEKYSLIISNHLGLFDVVSSMAIHGPGFIAKEAVKNYPFFGQVAKALHCVFVNRENSDSRKNIIEEIGNKQRNFYNGKDLAPLVIFPEGTTTSGRHLLRFKKGAFYHLLPIKPQFFTYDSNCIPHIAIGARNIFFHTHELLALWKQKIFYTMLPVIKPTKFMFDNYSHLGKEKWEIYAEVTRKIMCEVGGFKESNLGYRDSRYYFKCMSEGKYIPEDADTKTD